MNNSKILFAIFVSAFLVVSMAAAESIDPPPLPGEDGDLDTEPDEPPTPDDGTTASDEELEDSSDFDPDRVDQERGVDETGNHGDGGVERTGISGVFHSIASVFTGILPF